MINTVDSGDRECHGNREHVESKVITEIEMEDMVDGNLSLDETEVDELRSRVDQLEDKVDTLESELRLMRRKIRSIDSSRYGYNMLRRAFVGILNDNSWNISLNKPKSESSDEDSHSASFSFSSIRKKVPIRTKPIVHTKSEHKHQFKSEFVKIQRPDSASEVCERMGGTFYDLLQDEHPMDIVNDDHDYTPCGVDSGAESEWKDEDCNDGMNRKPKLNGKGNRGRERNNFSKGVMSAICKNCGIEIPQRSYLLKEHLQNCQVTKSGLSYKSVDLLRNSNELDSSEDVGSYQKNKTKNRSVETKTSALGRRLDDVWSSFSKQEVNGKLVATCKECGHSFFPRAYMCKKHLFKCTKSRLGFYDVGSSAYLQEPEREISVRKGDGGIRDTNSERKSRGRHQDNVWFHFEKSYPEGKGMLAVCKKCQKKVTARPARMKNHLSICWAKSKKSPISTVVFQD